MRITLPAPHRFSVDLSTEWLADAMDPATVENHGLFVGSTEHGVFLNLHAVAASPHPLTCEGLLSLLRGQGWASPPFDEWVTTPGALPVVGW